MIAPGLTQADLLALWERGEGARVTGRAMALLAGAVPADVGSRELWSMPVGRRDAALLELRESLFGGAFAGITTCPACAQQLELTFEANDIRRPSAEQQGDTLVLGATTVSFRLPSTADLAAIESAPTIDAARAALFERCVTSAVHGGEELPASALPHEVVEAVAARMAELDPQADVTIDVDCPDCGHAWREPFDVVTFLWNELAVWARHLLVDIHTLARAYGWSEESLVRMAPARRNAYLEMLQ